MPEGIPMVDVHDGLFGVWCELNFSGGVKGAFEEDLRLDYSGIEATARVSLMNLPPRCPLSPKRKRPFSSFHCWRIREPLERSGE